MSSLALQFHDRRPNRRPRVLGLVPASAGEARLVERDVELEALRRAVDGLTDGRGGVVLVDAPAGLGKTSLLEFAARRATNAACLVRRASPGPFELKFPFGVIRTLLEASVRDATRTVRAGLQRGVAAAAADLLVDGVVPHDLETTRFAHGILWLCDALAAEQPLALIVDDAHWSDRASLEVLSYLAGRIDDLPVLLVIAARGNHPDACTDVLSLLANARSATVVRPQPLTPTGAVRVIHQLAPESPVGICRRLHGAVGGAPWLLTELRRQVVAHGPTDEVATGVAPITAAGQHVIRRRLAEIGPEPRAVAAALAVAGQGASERVVARVADVPFELMASTQQALVAAGLVAHDAWSFPHHLIAQAIVTDLAPVKLERLHCRAASALQADDAGEEVVARHLLRCRPRGERAASELLLRAAANARDRGEPRTAAAYLERALDERAPGQDRGRALTLLAGAAHDAGMPNVRRRLREVVAVATDGTTRIDALAMLGGLAWLDGDDARLSAWLEEEVEATPGSHLPPALDAVRLDALLAATGRHLDRSRSAAAISVTAVADPLLRAVALAHQAWLDTEVGSPDAGLSAAMALQSLSDDILLDEATRRSAYHLAVRVLVLTDRPARATRAIAALEERAAKHASRPLKAAAGLYASELALRAGRVSVAEHRARQTLELLGGDHPRFVAGAVGVLVVALAERGAHAQAREVLGEHDSLRDATGVVFARARLALAEGDFEGAYADARATGIRGERQGRTNPSLTPWRSTAALALAHLGRSRHAAELADVELTMARHFGARIPIARALHARAVAADDDALRVKLCEHGLTVLDGLPAALESVRLKLLLGGSLSRMGRRIQARHALRPAFADAEAAGASQLAQHARRELVATGLRPRRAAVEGAAALTPRERQICELATAGKANRAIANELFLSVKTVETHLAASFRKLGVRSRSQLAQALDTPAHARP
jgi:DNA-binding CsgD family transcriptional regulator